LERHIEASQAEPPECLLEHRHGAIGCLQREACQPEEPPGMIALRARVLLVEQLGQLDGQADVQAGHVAEPGRRGDHGVDAVLVHAREVQVELIMAGRVAELEPPRRLHVPCVAATFGSWIATGTVEEPKRRLRIPVGLVIDDQRVAKSRHSSANAS
jgi:hypothetical protein